MIFEKEYFDTYCGGKPYEETLGTHLITYSRMCEIYTHIVNPPNIHKWMKKQWVLDAGCGMGHVVNDLTCNGVGCNGYDISDYAIKHSIPNISDVIWQSNHDDQLHKFGNELFSIVFANSFQYAKDREQSKEWLKQAFRICSHSLFFVSVTVEGLSRSISGSDIWEFQLIKNKKWWMQLFNEVGFKEVCWIGDVIAICLKQPR